MARRAAVDTSAREFPVGADRARPDARRPQQRRLCTREPVIVAYLAALFTDALEGTRPLPAHASAGISPREQALLEHLAAGALVAG